MSIFEEYGAFIVLITADDILIFCCIFFLVEKIRFFVVFFLWRQSKVLDFAYR